MANAPPSPLAKRTKKGYNNGNDKDQAAKIAVRANTGKDGREAWRKAKDISTL